MFWRCDNNAKNQRKIDQGWLEWPACRNSKNYTGISHCGKVFPACRVCSSCLTLQSLCLYAFYLHSGGSCHRFDLSQMVMLKDNHIKTAGGITAAVDRVKLVRDFSSKLEVECSSLDDAIEAAGCSADIVMFDNFNSLVSFSEFSINY